MVSESEMKALKKQRNNDYLHFELNQDEEWDVILARPLPCGPHAPNKNESKALRRICSQTGLTPEQVRLHKVYRQELALFAKVVKHDFKLSPEMTRIKRRAKYIRKSISTQTNMHPSHPHFLELFAKRWVEESYHFMVKLTPIKALNLSLS